MSSPAPGTQPRHRATLAGAPAAQAIELRKVYGTGHTEVTALDGVTATFPVAEFTAIMGPSGSGKSTFMHCLAGLDQPTSGEVIIGGDRLAGMSDKRLTTLRRDKVGFVFQQFNLLPTLTAEENVLLPLAIAGEKPDKAWIEELLGRVGLRDRRKHRPAELSGGQQQRVAVARALVARPAVVFADEPTGNLDSRTGADILALLQELHAAGSTIVTITHDLAIADAFPRRVEIRDGELVS